MAKEPNVDGVTDPEGGSQEPRPDGNDGMSRRDALKVLGVGGVAGVFASIFGTRALAKVVYDNADATQRAELEKQGILEELRKEAESMPAHEGLSNLDKNTARAIVLAFLGIVGRGLFFNGAMDQQTAFLMNSLALLRVSLLKGFGTEKDKKVAEDEAHHLLTDLPPALVLTAISDATTSELKLDMDQIFAGR